MPKTPPRYDDTAEAILDSWCRATGIDPAAFRRWTRGAEEPPQWFRDAIREVMFPLTSAQTNSTIRTMTATEIDKAKRGRPLVHTDHPFIKALEKAGVPLVEEARAVARTPGSLRNFLYPASHKSCRPVPRHLAEMWQKKYGVPLSAWSKLTK